MELSSLAVAQFFAEHGLTPQVNDSRYGRHYRAGSDVFGLDAELLAGCAAVYDRAALIALPPPLRRRYVHELHALLPADCRGLLITLDPPHEKQGPPFAVAEAEVRELYGRDWRVETLERRDILAQQPGFVAEGVSALETAVYGLSKR